MTIGIESFPKDENGIIVGEWRLKHKDSNFSESFGGIVFVDGVTIKPVSGRFLYRMIAAMGHVLDAEPWDDKNHKMVEPTAERKVAHGPKAYRVDVVTRPLKPIAEKPSSQPTEKDIQVKPVEKHEDELEDLDRDALISLSESLDLDIDKRWGADRLRSYIRECCDA